MNIALQYNIMRFFQLNKYERLFKIIDNIQFGKYNKISIKLFKYTIKGIDNINYRNKDNDTILLHACKMCDTVRNSFYFSPKKCNNVILDILDIINIILKYKPNIDLKDSLKINALSYIIMYFNMHNGSSGINIDSAKRCISLIKNLILNTKLTDNFIWILEYHSNHFTNDDLHEILNIFLNIKFPFNKIFNGSSSYSILFYKPIELDILDKIMTLYPPEWTRDLIYQLLLNYRSNSSKEYVIKRLNLSLKHNLDINYLVNENNLFHEFFIEPMLCISRNTHIFEEPFIYDYLQWFLDNKVDIQYHDDRKNTVTRICEKLYKNKHSADIYNPKYKDRVIYLKTILRIILDSSIINISNTGVDTFGGVVKAEELDFTTIGGTASIAGGTIGVIDNTSDTNTR